MIRIDLPWFANVITAIENLRKVKTGATAAAVLYRLRIAGGQIGVLYDGSLYAPFLKISRQKSLELRDVVNRLVDWCGQNDRVPSGG
ncbi:hypothetical protein, partial [Ensifer aridi]|uniref:hypothetical protein n=1 Tax=Ensifer aridi TaxID=1708715 RepID=UPI001AEC8225